MAPGAADVDVEASCAAAGFMSAGVTMAIAAAALILGFLIGTRGRQILATMKVARETLTSWSFRVPSAAALAAADADAGKDDNELETVEEDWTNTLDEFLSSEHILPLEEHPDVHINPILLYEARKAKEKAKEDRKLKAITEMREKLIAEGLSEDEIDERMAEGDATMLDGAPVRQNALAVLISVGARVVPGAASGSADSLALQDRKRQQKNIEMYLANSLMLDMRKTKAVGKNAIGVRMKNAYEMAKQTVAAQIPQRARARSVETAVAGAQTHTTATLGC